MTEWATVVKDGYEVPLILIPKESMLQKCDLCHDDFKMSEVELVGGQMFCAKCKKENHD